MSFLEVQVLVARVCDRLSIWLSFFFIIGFPSWGTSLINLVPITGDIIGAAVAMSNDCAQRVVWGFGIGGGLGASIGMDRVALTPAGLALVCVTFSA